LFNAPVVPEGNRGFVLAELDVPTVVFPLLSLTH